MPALFSARSEYRSPSRNAFNMVGTEGMRSPGNIPRTFGALYSDTHPPPAPEFRAESAVSSSSSSSVGGAVVGVSPSASEVSVGAASSAEGGDGGGVARGGEGLQRAYEEAARLVRVDEALLRWPCSAARGGVVRLSLDFNLCDQQLAFRVALRLELVHVADGRLQL